MAEFGARQTVTTDTGSVVFNEDFTAAGVAGCRFLVDNIEGLDDAPVRSPQDDKPRTGGGYVYDILDGARHITIEGTVVVGPTSSYNEIVARNTMERNLKDVLRGARTADGSYTHEPSGFAADTWIIRNDVPVTYPGRGTVKRFIFGLVAGNPDTD